MSVSSVYPIAFLDPPEVFDCSVSPIPASSDAPLQVIANIGSKAALCIDYIDTTGEYIGVYVGDPGEEKLNCIIGGGQNARAITVIQSYSRVCFRSMNAQIITQGKIMCTFLGNGL